MRINWYRTPIDAVKLAKLIRRSDWQGYLHVFAHLLLLTFTGSVTYFAYLEQHFLLTIGALFIHGSFYSFLGWAGAGHELLHRTVFKSRRYNDFFLFLFAFLTWNNYVYFRASHVRHHQCTVFTELDGEVTLPQKIHYADWLWALAFNLPACYRAIRIVVENSVNIIKGEWGAKLFPEAGSESRHKVVLTARIVLVGHLLLVTVFFITGHWPLLFIVTLAPFISDWLNKLLALAQHYGMQSNVADFRRNSRTVLLHPFLACLYWQMNYHVEHHMYPGVPFYNLHDLRHELEHDFPVALQGILAIIREITTKARQ
ncbi:MAG: fatty acid desaturase [Accumulibacter sp.]|uniref:fatty acid desaturase n=1 Tax=Accumulibacter sp. TaxID=2053492 RepID=UPI0033148283